jgi:glycosyltransferase involved in cell wall biosynthesis
VSAPGGQAPDATPEAPHLSLVVPVHGGADYIVENVQTIVRTLEELGRPFEVLAVSDGDEPSADALGALDDPRVRSFRYAVNEGKGYAISYGIAHARGRLIGWLDGDLDVDPRVILDAVARFDREEVDAVVGSKRHPASAVQYPWQRRVLSWGFQLLILALFRVEVRDTQVGAKVFRREMLDTVAPLLLIKRYAFDLEVIAVGAEFGFDRVREVPVRLDYRFTGTGINSSAVRLMFKDTLAIAYRIHLRHWYVRQYASRQRERGDLLGRVAPEELSEHLAPVSTTTLARIRASLR